MKNLIFAIFFIGSTFAQAEQYFNLDYTRDEFNQHQDPWNLYSLSYGCSNDKISLIPRFNYAERFDEKGTQIEFDAYPKIAKGQYVYLNYGYSSSFLFPNHRFGAEFFQNFNSLEASIGFRKLWFSSSQPTIWTGSLAWYFGSYYISLRPYFTPKEIGDSLSVTIEVRKYYTDDHFIYAKIGGGSYNDQKDTSFEIYRSDSRWYALGGNYALRSDLILTGGLRYEEVQQTGKTQATTTLGVQTLF